MPVGFGGVHSPAGGTGSSSVPGAVTLMTVSGTTSTGPAASGATWENIGSTYSIPANTFGKVGDSLDVCFAMDRGASAGLGDARMTIGGTTCGDLTSYNLGAGLQGSVIGYYSLVRLDGSTLAVIGYAVENSSTPGFAQPGTITTIGGLTFTGAITLALQVRESATTNATTRRFLRAVKTSAP